jgi:hypothetical protein
MSSTIERAVNLPEVTCAGSAVTRGEMHGETLREQIRYGLGQWADAIAEWHGVDPNAYIAGFVAGTDYLPAIRTSTPDLLIEIEEIEGIARGSAQPWEWIYAYNLLDEEWTWARSQKAGSAPGCTVAGFSPENGATVLTQTMDIPNVHDGTQAVLRIEADDAPSALVFTHAGMIGLTGCNSAGMAVVVNNLDVLPASPTGLPVAFVLRGLLERETRQDAVAFAREVPHATGQHYGIADPTGLSSVEGWGAGVAVVDDAGARLLHTNHPLLTDQTEGEVESRYHRTRTRERLRYLETEAGAARGVDETKALLCDRTVPVSLGADRPSMTFGAVVYECRVPARMGVAPGPPHETSFVSVDW